MATILAGSKAPDFRIPDQHGEVHSLSDYRGRCVVVYFYPKDSTSGCTAEACQFRDHHPDFAKVGATVLGISPDSVDSHGMFAGDHGLNFKILADVPGTKGVPPVCAAYGVWARKSMYGRTYMGVVRTTFLIDGDGRVVRRWDRVKVPGHAAEVLASVKALHGGAFAPVNGRVKAVKRGKAKAAKRASASRPDSKARRGRKTASRASTASARRARPAARGKPRAVGRG